MNSEAEASAERARAIKWRDELRRYHELFAGAFDELHEAVKARVKQPGQYVGAHHDYPLMSSMGSGFPAFREAGFYDDKTPRHYVATIRPHGLLGIFGALPGTPAPNLPKGTELASFLRTHKIGKRLNLGALSNRPVDELVADAVERYIHLYGLDTPVNDRRRDALIWPLISGTVFKSLNLRLVVPIALTHFDVDHFRLTDTTYITRLPKKLQLARARMSTLGSGAVRMVVGAATHAFVSTGWNLEADTIDDVSASLKQSSSNVIDAIDSFFGALRIVAGIKTGYAQFLWLPKDWALEYFCDLTPVYGTTLRRYPAEYDNYGWTEASVFVTKDQLAGLRAVYKHIADNQSEAVRLAISRLNGCLTRSDEGDSILDGTIGLELLLGDKDNQSLSYKLRLRAAALAALQGDPAFQARDVFMEVKRLYEARSAIVHGLRKKQSKKAIEPEDARNSKERMLASELLGFVLKVLLAHPQYQEPARIDEGLLLGGDSAVQGLSPNDDVRPISEDATRDLASSLHRLPGALPHRSQE
ncbi:hypothetical protein AAE026_26675 [Bradyrhizobium sp. DN5]|uniref:hypothetical protein n=1 Tax=Bradyrhizobium sp. DN5 TaxID=3056950 RepID=UPI003525CC0A